MSIQEHLVVQNDAFINDCMAFFPKTSRIELQRRLNSIALDFQATDNDKSGDIDLSEIGAVLAKIGHPRNKAELKAAIRRVDDDDTGTLRYREFINLVLVETQFISEPVPETKPMKKAGGLGRRERRKGALKKKKRGMLKLKIEMEEKPGKYLLSCSIYEAKSLLPADLNGLADPYVKMKVLPDPSKKTKQKTKTIRKCLDPSWNEKFSWELDKSDLKQRRLHIEIWDWDRLNRNDFMGAMSFDIEDLLDPSNVSSGWFILLDEEQGKNFNFPAAVPKSIARHVSVQQAQKTLQTPTSSTSLCEKDFKYLKVLGRGSFGKVFLAEKKDNSQLYAIKVLKKSRVIEDDDVEATITEKSILSMGDGKFVIHLHAAFQNEGNLFFVMELIEGGDLMYYAMTHGAFSQKATAFYAAEISSGLMYLHDNKIIYRDLKLDNVLMDRDGHIRIADFGLCKMGLAPGMKTQTFCGTPNYLAPEVVTYKPYDKSVDWWSLGVVMFEMLNGIVLFDGDTEQELFRSILRQPISLPMSMSKEAKMIVLGFLDRNPEKRLGYGPNERQDIEAHPFFKGIDWAQLHNREVKPPFVPKLKGPKDTSNFDPEFTIEKPVITPPTSHELAEIDQAVFAGFEYEAAL